MNALIPVASRVVIALDPAGTSDAALEIAQHLPAGAATELLGVFIEDIRLLEHARSPLAREVVLSGLERPLELAALERQIRAQARQARTRFEAAAARIGLPYVFQIARGEIIPELLREAEHADALVVSFAAAVTGRRSWWGTAMQQLARAPLRTLLFAREGWNTGTSILTVVRDAVDAADAAQLQTAARLSRLSRSRLTVLRVGRLDAQSIALAARAENARLVILPSSEPAANVDLIGALFKTIPGSLLLLAEH